MLVRAWPRLVCAPLRRGGGSASDQMMKRMEKWRDWRFEELYTMAVTQDRDVDLYHWSSAKFESTWRDTISVLVARGRAQVGVHSAKSDWSRRILDFAYMDYDDKAAHHE